VTAKHAYNRRQGWTRDEDTLPPRLLGVPLTLPSGREAVLTRERLDAMVDRYHAARGLDKFVHKSDPAPAWP
jgi:aldehyde:ferredoxin oxidoreductase